MLATVVAMLLSSQAIGRAYNAPEALRPFASVHLTFRFDAASPLTKTEQGDQKEAIELKFRASGVKISETLDARTLDIFVWSDVYGFEGDSKTGGISVWGGSEELLCVTACVHPLDPKQYMAGIVWTDKQHILTFDSGVKGQIRDKADAMVTAFLNAWLKAHEPKSRSKVSAGV